MVSAISGYLLDARNLIQLHEVVSKQNYLFWHTLTKTKQQLVCLRWCLDYFSGK